MKNSPQFHKIGLFAALPFALLGLGCDDPPEPGAKIDSFRVLAEQADLPYARPGETVQLSSLSFDPQARPVTWAWASCANPISNDLNGCLATIAEAGDPAISVFAMGAGTSTAALTIPSDAIDSLPAAARGAATVGVLSVACPGDLSFGAGPGGLPTRCQETGTGRDMELDEFIVGYKRIAVRRTDRNQNPEITGITFDGTDWPATETKLVGFCDQSDFIYDTCPDGEKHQLAATVSSASFESGNDELGRPFEEQLVIQHYATEGIFEFEVRTGKSPKTGWVARKAASGQTLSMWFVARDDRGGVSWAERKVTVR
jgi:hypothetical protein